jgi:hypothetical protein
MTLHNLNIFNRNRSLAGLLWVVLLAVILPATKMSGATYTFSLGAKTWSAYGDQTLNSVNWTLAGTANAYFGYDAAKGQQFGSAANPATPLSLSTSGITGTISSVKVSTSGASGIAGTVAVSVGGTAYSPATVTLTNVNATYEFTGSASGQIKISWTQTSSKAVYLQSVEVSYGSSTPVAAPVFSPVGGSYTSAQSVTLSSATQGAKIYYTTDGSTPDKTKTLYQSAISVNTTTTIKAIAYDSNNLNPSTVTSATYTFSIAGPGTPVATEATNISSTSFKANWNNVETATGYKLNVYKSESSSTESTVLAENFDKFSAGATGSGATSADVAATLDSYTQTSGWTGVKIYQAGGTAKFGTSSVLGYIVTPALDLSANGGAFTLSFKSMAWSTDATELYIYLNDVLVYTLTGLDNSTYTLKEFTVPLTGGTASSKIKFEGKQAAKGRFFLEDLTIKQGGGQSFTAIEGSPFTVNGSNAKDITGLTPATTYKYNLTAFNSSGQESALSNSIVVKTVDGVSPAVSVSVAQLSGFTYVQNHGPSAAQSFTVSGSNLQNDITMTAPADFEISKNAASGYSASVTLSVSQGTVAATTIYVRMKAGLNADDYSGETLIVSAAGATSVSVTLNGSVTEEVVEPSEHVTNFSATLVSPARTTITVTWTDVVGADGYLIKGSAAGLSSVAAPVDGTAETNAALVKNVAKGIQTVDFTDLSFLTTYYFKIWPYTGTGSAINYKTDGSVPTAQATTLSNISTGEKPVTDADKALVYANELRQLNITLPGEPSADASVTVYNSTGQTVWNALFNKAQTLVSQPLKPGIYMVAVYQRGLKTVRKLTL